VPIQPTHQRLAHPCHRGTNTAADILIVWHRRYNHPVPQSSTAGLILAIESSCDETAAAIVRGGADVLSNVVASQIALHARFGGVVPELASREHLRNIVPVVHTALAEAGVSFADLDAIAVTEGPGLAGALLVGITYAKTLAFGLGKPLIAVNHLEGHVHAVLMDARRSGSMPDRFPLLALVVSGGHTHLYLAEENDGAWSYRNIGRTVDDAAGEAYDKTGKLLGLPYPAGPWMDALAALGNPLAVPFHFREIRPRAGKIREAQASAARTAGASPLAEETVSEPRFDFSFSGIKTSVLRFVETHAMGAGTAARREFFALHPDLKPTAAREFAEDLPGLFDTQTLDLIASFQSAIVGNLLRQTFAAASRHAAHGILVSGGVAANRELRARFTTEAITRNTPVAFPAFALSTDNAAMIAAAAWPKLHTRTFAADNLTATPQLRLG
jgi:N6-L-threonylcarbamoyladenine synthase